MVLPRARSALSSAMLCSLWFHFRRTGQARATACASTVSHDAFLITPPSGPPSPPVEVDLRASAVLSSSECLFSGGDDALATHFLALTHEAWPNHYYGATTKSSTTKSSTTAQLQHLRRGPNSAAARTQRNPELQQ